MSNFSPISRQEQEAWVTYWLGMLRCREAASKAHGPGFKKLWLKKADDLEQKHLGMLGMLAQKGGKK